MQPRVCPGEGGVRAGWRLEGVYEVTRGGGLRGRGGVLVGRIRLAFRVGEVLSGELGLAFKIDVLFTPNFL